MVYTIILGILFGVGALVTGGIAIWGAMDDGTVRKCVGGILCPILFILFLCIPFSFHQIEAGEVAVVKHMGEISGVQNPGISFKFWMTDKYEIYDAKVQTLEVVDSAYSKDAQTMDIQMTIQYQINTDDVEEIAKNYGNLEALSNRIRSVAIEKTKAVLSTHRAMNDSNEPNSTNGIIENRDAVGKEVTEKVTEALNGYYITVNTVALTNIDFSDAFEKTVEDKMIAEQQKLQAQYENEKKIAEARAKAEIAEVEAKAKIEVAKSEAEALLARAEGDASAQKTIAAAEAYATQKKLAEVARTLGHTVTEDEEGLKIIWADGTDDNMKKAVLSYIQYLEYLATWNGELPNVVTGSDGLILIPSQG